MVEYIQGDIFGARAEAVINPVNCAGVMGAGLAKQFKERYPDNFRAYRYACQRGEVQPGRICVFDRGPGKQPRYIFNVPTKRHWRDGSKISDIRAGLMDLLESLGRRPNITSVAMPALGAGLGGLRWPDVRHEIEAVFGSVQAPHVTVYLPRTSPPKRVEAVPR